MFNKLTILVLIALLVPALAAATGCSSKATGEIASPPAATAEQNPTATTTPNTPTKTSDGHIVQEVTPTPTPPYETKTLEYVYNPIEYYLASYIEDLLVKGRFWYGGGSEPWKPGLGKDLRSYNLTEEQVTFLRENHTINKGDTVLIRATSFSMRTNKSYGVVWLYLKSPPEIELESEWTNDTAPKFILDLYDKMGNEKLKAITVKAIARDHQKIKIIEIVEIEK